MKKHRLITVLILSLSLILCSALIASADDSDNPLNLHQTACTSSSITFTWDNVKQAEGKTINNWTLLIYDPTVMENDNFSIFEDYDAYKTCKVGTNTLKFSNLPQGKIYGAILLSDTDYFSAYIGYTKPENLKKTDFALYSTAAASKSTQFKAKFKVNIPEWADGVELKIYKYGSTSPSVTKTITSTYSSYSTLNKNAAYKYRARAYLVDPDTNKKVYSEKWSSYKYFDNPKATYTTKSSLKGCKLSLKGIKGVSKYKIYVSTSKSSNFKLTKTVSPKLGKTVKYSITKIGSSSMKKGKTYYVRVIPYIKNGTSTPSKSDMYGEFSFKNPK